MSRCVHARPRRQFQVFQDTPSVWSPASFHLHRTENIKDLFKALQLIRSINSKTPDVDLGNIDFDYSSYLDSSPITFESDYIAGADQIDFIPGIRPGGDMDSLDNVLEFKTKDDDESRKD